MSIDLSPLGFRKTPFTRELAVRERCTLEHQAAAAAALTAAVQERMSAALIAPAGTGKTVALRMLVAQLAEARFQVRYVKVTGLSKRDLCKELAVACGLSPTGIYPALVRKLQEAFDHTVSDGMRPVILLDEAHDLRPESLAMLRVLTLCRPPDYAAWWSTGGYCVCSSSRNGGERAARVGIITGLPGRRGERRVDDSAREWCGPEQSSPARVP